MIRTVIYDLDDTLYDFHRVDRMAFDAMCRACDERGVDGGELVDELAVDALANPWFG